MDHERLEVFSLCDLAFEGRRVGRELPGPIGILGPGPLGPAPFHLANPAPPATDERAIRLQRRLIGAAPGCRSIRGPGKPARECRDEQADQPLVDGTHESSPVKRSEPLPCSYLPREPQGRSGRIEGTGPRCRDLSSITNGATSEGEAREWACRLDSLSPRGARSAQRFRTTLAKPSNPPRLSRTRLRFPRIRQRRLSGLRPRSPRLIDHRPRHRDKRDLERIRGGEPGQAPNAIAKATMLKARSLARNCSALSAPSPGPI